MSTEITPSRKSRLPKSLPSVALDSGPVSWTLYLVDGSLLAIFLGLVFLLGVFPMKDTDFWWHLRTGDWIRTTGQVPTHDLYTFTVADHAWTDLHWMFQLAISWGYQHGGVVALNLAKCVITCAAVALLILCKRREWPLWAMLLAWIPALLVLSGRMYVRPETLTLLYLSGFLAVLCSWERAPLLAFFLPPIQLAWVNTQGLFVLGPIVLGFALLEAVLRPHAFSDSRKRWWKIVGVATVLTGLVCFVNPYGIRGALYPLELAGTMGNPLFSETIAELTPIPTFIKRNVGWSNLPLQLHIATMILGGLSFLIPMTWVLFQRASSSSAPSEPESKPGKTKEGKVKGDGKPRRKKLKGKHALPEIAEEPAWRLSVFRLCLYVAFSVLSWQATRNSHQFAAVVGAITAWNFGAWGAAINAKRSQEGTRFPAVPRVAMFVALSLLLLLVGSGKFYAMTGEGRVIGLGEEPLWYPHDAVKFCGKLGMPERFLSFHDGYSALYDYHNGPDRKVFADARLEVIGPELYERYLNLKQRIATNDASWPRELDQLGRPAVLVGHADNSSLGAVLMANSHWRCVWFDAIAAVFVHDSFTGATETHTVDFAARHYRPDPAVEPKGIAALTASAKALWYYTNSLLSASRSDMARPMTLLGLDHARRVRRTLPNALDGWKLSGGLELTRDKLGSTSVPRFRQSFDPLFDLSRFRSTYLLHRASEVAPTDFMTHLLLASSYAKQSLDEAALPVVEQLLALHPINQEQLRTQNEMQKELEQLVRKLGIAEPSKWTNLNELDQVVTRLLAAGRVGSAADLLEQAYPDSARTWEVSERIATLRLHLGDPEHARQVLQNGLPPAQTALRASRVAMTFLIEDEFDQARRLFDEAIKLAPDLFEARYGLAVLEQDAGRAAAAFSAAREAERVATNDFARSSAQAIAAESKGYVRQ